MNIQQSSAEKLFGNARPPMGYASYHYARAFESCILSSKFILRFSLFNFSILSSIEMEFRLLVITYRRRSPVIPFSVIALVLVPENSLRLCSWLSAISSLLRATRMFLMVSFSSWTRCWQGYSGCGIVPIKYFSLEIWVEILGLGRTLVRSVALRNSSFRLSLEIRGFMIDLSYLYSSLAVV